MKKRAVALKYPEGAEAPVIMAKGEGNLAEKILTEAKKNDILIKEDVTLVNLLGQQSVGDCVPEEAWNVLAQIFAFILEHPSHK